MRESTKIKHEFFNALKCGTGRAFMILKGNSNIDFSKLILKGAATNFANDPQSEGSRAWYIYNLIKKSKQKNQIIDAVLEKLKEENDDNYNVDQMCDLAIYFHKHGNSKAKKTIYEVAGKGAKFDTYFCGKFQLPELDGLRGFLKVAELVGEFLLENEDEYEPSWFADSFQKDNKSIDVYGELEKAAIENKFIAEYLKSIRENKDTFRKRKKIKRFTYQLVKERIQTGKMMRISVERANELTGEEVERLADDFLSEKKNRQREQYLRFFAKRKFPFEFQPILKIASGNDIRSRHPKIRLVEFACEALKFFRNSEIRKFALKKIATTKNPCNFLCLLSGNYEKGDYKLLNEVVARSNNYNFIHSLVYGLIDIYETNQVAECKEPLEAIYTKMNCGIHRHDVLRILEDNGVLSDEIFQEMKYDSYEDVRKLHKQIKKKRKSN